MTTGITIVPELALHDPGAGRDLLVSVFGFAALGDEVVLGSQRVALVQAAGQTGHGKIDHLALAVGDLDATLAVLLDRSARLEATTPDGPKEIAEFWGTGVRYVFLAGPEGARIELCARRGDAGGLAGLRGHDHIGIPCTDIAASEAFFLSLGLSPVAAVTLQRPEGSTPVRFLQAGATMVELYGPPEIAGKPAAFAPSGLWRGLRLEGSTLEKGVRIGPDNLRLTVL
jgi:catechol 2,3-dioxygenase-like lactoylglutathione lyase family enzyme